MTSEPIALHQREEAPADDRTGVDAWHVVEGGNAGLTAEPTADEVSPVTLRDEDRDDEQNPDAALLDHPEWDVSAMLSAATFDTVVPSAVLAARSTIYQTMNFQGLFSLDPYSLTEFFKQQLGEIGDDGKPKDEDDNLSIYADMASDEREERRREQNEWQQSQHELAGVSMTGKEWGELADAYSENGPLRQKLVDYLKSIGKTAEEAKKKAAKDDEIFRLMSKPASQRTPAEQAQINAANEDPEFRETLKWAKAQRDKAYGQSNEAEKTTTTANQTASVTSGADAFTVDSAGSSPSTARLISVAAASGAGAEFPSAPDLQEHHKAALAATEPLDAQKMPVKLALAAPVQAPGSGFDV